MPKFVISDTSCLILFSKIEQILLLQKVYHKVYTTPEIALEFNEELPSWIEIIPVSDKKYLEFLNTQVDLGEASAIALAKELVDVLVLMDDLKGRKLARKLNIKITGSLGVINKAKELGIINAVKPILEKIIQTDFRISENVINEFLILNKE
jgi:predicted nucleic acid-binding protein